MYNFQLYRVLQWLLPFKEPLVFLLTLNFTELSNQGRDGRPVGLT